MPLRLVKTKHMTERAHFICWFKERSWRFIFGNHSTTIPCDFFHAWLLKRSNLSAEISRPQIMFEIARQSFSFQHKTLGEIVKKDHPWSDKKEKFDFVSPSFFSCCKHFKAERIANGSRFCHLQPFSLQSFHEICSSHQPPILTGCDMSS